MLLILDNFEQVSAAAPMVSELFVAAGPTIVVTSRVALHVTGEQEFAVPPLSMPTEADAADLTSLTRTDAVALFVQRARGPLRFRAESRQRARHRGDLRPSRWSATRHRARRVKSQGAARSRASRAPRQPVRPAPVEHGRSNGPASARCAEPSTGATTCCPRRSGHYLYDCRLVGGWRSTRPSTSPRLQVR